MKLTREIVINYKPDWVEPFTAEVLDGMTFTIQAAGAPGPVLFVFTDEQADDPTGPEDQFEGDGNGKAVIGPDAVSSFGDNAVKNVAVLCWIDGLPVPVAQGIIAKVAFSRPNLIPAAVDQDVIVDGGLIVVDNI